MFAAFYEGKKVLVTGIAGVKGSWLALKLLQVGADVMGLDCSRPKPASNFTAAGLEGRIRFIAGDVTNLSSLQESLVGVDCVFHLAAKSLVGEAARSPLEAYRVNTLGTATVLEAFRTSDSARYAVFVTTDKVYSPKQGLPWVESDPLVASGPYQVGKACAEYIIRDYFRCYLRGTGKRIGIARAGNVVIGGDFNSSRTTEGAGRLFVDCYEALMEGRSPEIFRPNFGRPYTYGLDIISGYMTLMSNLEREGVDGEAFNFGPHEQYGVENALVATKICELWGGNVTWRTGSTREEPFEQQSLSWEKARNLLAWQPAYTLYEALRDTTKWYKAWLSMGRKGGAGAMHQLDLELIEAHCQAARRLGVRWVS